MSVGSAARNYSSLRAQNTPITPVTTEIETAGWVPEFVGSDDISVASMQAVTDPALDPDDQKIIINFSAFAASLRLCLLYDDEELQADTVTTVPPQEESTPIILGGFMFSATADELCTDNSKGLEESCV